MKTAYIVNISEGKGTLGAGRLFLTTATGETIRVAAKFAEANGINAKFRGAIMYDTEFCKKGDKYKIIVEGKETEKTFENDFTRVTRIEPADMSVLKSHAEINVLTAKKEQLDRMGADL